VFSLLKTLYEGEKETLGEDRAFSSVRSYIHRLHRLTDFHEILKRLSFLFFFKVGQASVRMVKERLSDGRAVHSPFLCVEENYFIPIDPVSQLFVVKFGVRGLRVILPSTCEFHESGRRRAL
jgi:hypothetical protein